MLNFTKITHMDAYKKKILDICNKASENTLMDTLGIEYIDVGEDFLVAKMPVTPAIHQPDGLLHGGATVALAESVGSTAAYIFIDAKKYFVRGIEISANHVKGVRDGDVFAKASIIHKGRTTQLWDIRVTDSANDLVSLCKLTTITLPKK